MWPNHALDLTEEMNGRHGSRHQVDVVENPNIASSVPGCHRRRACATTHRLIDMGDDRFHTLGDPTEGALVAAAAKMGYWKSSLDASFPRAAELPFDSERKRMTTVHHLDQYDPTVLSGLEVGSHRYIAFTKGSVDGLLDIVEPGLGGWKVAGAG